MRLPKRGTPSSQSQYHHHRHPLFFFLGSKFCQQVWGGPDFFLANRNVNSDCRRLRHSSALLAQGLFQARLYLLRLDRRHHPPDRPRYSGRGICGVPSHALCPFRLARARVAGQSPQCRLWCHVLRVKRGGGRNRICVAAHVSVMLPLAHFATQSFPPPFPDHTGGPEQWRFARSRRRTSSGRTMRRWSLTPLPAGASSQQSARSPLRLSSTTPPSFV